MSATEDIDRELEKLSNLAPSGYSLGLHIRFAAPLMVFQTYPPAWIDIYTSSGYLLRDPLVAWGFSTTGSCRWSEIEIPDPFGIMAQSAEYGLKYGVAISCGPLGSRTIGGAARPDREFVDAEIDAVAASVRRLHDVTEPPESLTKAQVEALRLIAAGDRHAAAAAKLNISESALKARLLSVRQKLLARTTAEAVQRAKDARLL